MATPTINRGPVQEVVLPRLPNGKIDVGTWAKSLGVNPIHDWRELAVGVWPDDEPVDDFLAARLRWRGEGRELSGE